eukprot:8108051-Lingulodinium_polyedra.AAC.1
MTSIRSHFGSSHFGSSDIAALFGWPQRQRYLASPWCPSARLHARGGHGCGAQRPGAVLGVGRPREWSCG